MLGRRAVVALVRRNPHADDLEVVGALQSNRVHRVFNRDFATVVDGRRVLVSHVVAALYRVVGRHECKFRCHGVVHRDGLLGDGDVATLVCGRDGANQLVLVGAGLVDDFGYVSDAHLAAIVGGCRILEHHFLGALNRVVGGHVGEFWGLSVTHLNRLRVDGFVAALVGCRPGANDVVILWAIAGHRGFVKRHFGQGAIAHGVKRHRGGNLVHLVAFERQVARQCLWLLGAEHFKVVDDQCCRTAATVGRVHAKSNDVATVALERDRTRTLVRVGFVQLHHQLSVHVEAHVKRREQVVQAVVPIEAYGAAHCQAWRDGRLDDPIVVRVCHVVVAHNGQGVACDRNAFGGLPVFGRELAAEPLEVRNRHQGRRG